MLIYLVEIDAYNPGTSSVVTLRYSTHGYTSRGTDTPANTHYDARVAQPGLMRRDVFSQGTTGGAVSTGYGLVELNNNDGALDYLIDYGFDARAFRVLVGDHAKALSTFTVALKGTMEQADFSWGKMSIRIRDRLAELDKPVNTTLYTGGNSLPNGLEGTADDLKGKAKPKAWGRNFNVQPPCVNTTKLIYQLNDGAITFLDKVYNTAGQEITKETPDYPDLTTLQSTPPAAGKFRVYLAGGYFRLGTDPQGPVTCDGGNNTNGQISVAQVLKSMATGPGGISGSDVVDADVTALDTATVYDTIGGVPFSSDVGIWVNEGGNLKEAMDAVANSVGAWYGFDRLGRLRMAQITAPSGTPVATFTGNDLISIEKVPTADSGKGIPAYKAEVKYYKNNTVQTSGLLVTSARASWLASEYRTLSATYPSVLTAHPLAPTISAETLLTQEATATIEATRLLNLYSVRRDRLNVRVRVTQALAEAIDLGVVVKITLPRFGYDSGKLFRVLGIQTDFRTGTLDLTLWG